MPTFKSLYLLTQAQKDIKNEQNYADLIAKR